MALARALLRTQAAPQPSPLRRVSVLLHRPAAPLPRAAVRRWLSEKTPTPPKGDKKPLTWKHTEKAKANADTQEKVFNTLVPKRNMTWKSPLFWAVLCGVCYVPYSYYNSQESEKEKAKFDPSSTLVEPTSASRGEAPAALPAASSDPSVLASASTSVTPSSSHTEKEEVKKGPFADGSGHPKANFFFSDMPKAVRLAMRFDTEALYSVTDCRSAAKMTEKIAAALEAQKSAGGTSIPSAADAVVTDMTACVGGNVISFARRFRAVNAIEIDATRHAMLKHNVAVVAEHANVTFVQGDAVSLLLNPTASPLVQDVLFMDPPWGGPDYMASSSLHLSLGGKDVGVLTRLLLETKAASLVALKVPTNFALDDFRSDVAPAVVEEHCDLRKMKLLIVSPPATR